MTGQKALGFQERPHTADWALDVWAPDLPTLLEQAARGMYALMGTRLRAEPRTQRSFELRSSDPESLLVAFLSELLYWGEQEGLGFDTFHLALSGETLQANVGGAPIESQSKEIKAVTYHNLAIRQGERGLETTVVFDV